MTAIWEGILGLNTWIFSKAGDIETACNFDGGWEGWTQIELAMTSFWASRPVDITREAKLWGTGDLRRADLLFNPKPNTVGAPVVLELKCKTKLELPGAFGQRLLDDHQKLFALQNFAGEKWVYGIMLTTSEDALNVVQNAVGAQKLTSLSQETIVNNNQWYWFLTDPNGLVTFFVRVV